MVGPLLSASSPQLGIAWRAVMMALYVSADTRVSPSVQLWGESPSQSRWKAAKYPVIWTEQTKKDPVSNLHMWGVQVWRKSKAVHIQSVYVEHQ